LASYKAHSQKQNSIICAAQAETSTEAI